MKDIASYYNKEQGKILIEVNAKNAKRLFNSLDPSPVEEKDLDDATAEYIAGAANEFGPKRPMKLVLYLPASEIDKNTTEALTAAVHNYFAYRAVVMGRELRELLRIGRVSLLIGIAWLVLCITARELMSQVLSIGMLRTIVVEGLLITGWVAMWRPIQVFLYDWWPIARRKKVREKLAAMEIEVCQAD